MGDFDEIVTFIELILVIAVIAAVAKGYSSIFGSSGPLGNGVASSGITDLESAVGLSCPTTVIPGGQFACPSGPSQAAKLDGLAQQLGKTIAKVCPNGTTVTFTDGSVWACNHLVYCAPAAQAQGSTLDTLTFLTLVGPF